MSVSSMLKETVTVTRSKVIWQYTTSLQTGGSKSQSPLPMGGPGPLSNTMLLGTTQVSLPNVNSFHPMALSGSVSVTDR